MEQLVLPLLRVAEEYLEEEEEDSEEEIIFTGGRTRIETGIFLSRFMTMMVFLSKEEEQKEYHKMSLPKP